MALFEDFASNPTAMLGAGILASNHPGASFEQALGGGFQAMFKAQEAARRNAAQQQQAEMNRLRIQALRAAQQQEEEWRAQAPTLVGGLFPPMPDGTPDPRAAAATAFFSAYPEQLGSIYAKQFDPPEDTTFMRNMAGLGIDMSTEEGRAAAMDLYRTKGSTNINMGSPFGQPRVLSGAEKERMGFDHRSVVQVTPKGELKVVQGKTARTKEEAVAVANLSGIQDELATVDRYYFGGTAPSLDADGKLSLKTYNRANTAAAAANLPGTDGRTARQAMRRAVETMLRMRTGAAAPQHEVDSYEDQFSPSVWDTEEQAARKRIAMGRFAETALSAMKSRLESGQATPEDERALAAQRDSDAPPPPPGFTEEVPEQ